MSSFWDVVCVVAVQVLTAVYFSGRQVGRVEALDVRMVDKIKSLEDRLVEKVKTLDDRTVDHGRRLSNAESVLSGPGGHGERITAIEAWRIESRAKQS